MVNTHLFKGVFAAAVTPLKSDYSPDLDGLVRLVQFLSNRGCHGILLTGTTGEGPSLSREERLLIYKTVASARSTFPHLQLLAGTGTPSLEDTVFLTRTVFDLGYDGVVVLPPYYFRKTSDDGLFAWFSYVLHKSVPTDGALFGYHIPPISGVSLSLELLSRLKDSFPEKFVGIKDSSADPDHARALGAHFGKELIVLTGNDRLFTLALNSHASGCITAMANILSPLHRLVWDSFQSGNQEVIAQDKISRFREILDRYPPMPPLLKFLLSSLHGFPYWQVKPPLQNFNSELSGSVLSDYNSIKE